MTRKTHPNKEIEEALKEIEKSGWVVKDSGKSAHSWGKIRCPYRDTPCVSNHEWCTSGVWSTPKSPGNHAKSLKRLVNRCVKFQEERIEKEREDNS